MWCLCLNKYVSFNFLSVALELRTILGTIALIDDQSYITGQKHDSESDFSCTFDLLKFEFQELYLRNLNCSVNWSITIYLLIKRVYPPETSLLGGWTNCSSLPSRFWRPCNCCGSFWTWMEGHWKESMPICHYLFAIVWHRLPLFSIDLDLEDVLLELVDPHDQPSQPI